MNKKELVRAMKQAKVGFVSTLASTEDAIDALVREAKHGGNVYAAALMLQNTIIEEIIVLAESPEVVEAINAE